MLSGNFKTALASLRESRWRTTFTMLGIIIGIASVVTVVSLGEGLKQQISGQINQLGPNVLTVRPGKVSNTGGLNSLYSFMTPSTLTSDDVKTLNGLPLVSKAAPIEFVTSTVKNGSTEMNNVFVAGTSANLGDILHQKIAYGDFYSDNTGFQNNFAMIGSNIAANLFNEHPRVQERFELSDKLLSGQRPAAHVVQAQGETLLEQLLWTINFGDFVTIYLALLNGVNPAPVDLVEKFKKELG